MRHEIELEYSYSDPIGSVVWICTGSTKINQDYLITIGFGKSKQEAKSDCLDRIKNKIVNTKTKETVYYDPQQGDFTNER